MLQARSISTVAKAESTVGTAEKVISNVRQGVKKGADFIRFKAEQLKLAMLAAFLLTFASVPTFAQSTPAAPTIDFDLTPFFDSLNTYLPIFMALFAIIGGIAGAMALSRYIVGAIVRAFSGGQIG